MKTFIFWCTLSTLLDEVHVETITRKNSPNQKACTISLSRPLRRIRTYGRYYRHKKFTVNVNLGIFGIIDSPINMTVTPQHENLIELNPSKIQISPTNQTIDAHYLISVKGVNPGLLDVIISTEPLSENFRNVLLKVTVSLSPVILHVSIVLGWLYFVAWSASFYPQIIDNHQRKSVVGLNFDYLSFIIVGSALCTAFNMGLLWCPLIEREYFRRYPRGLNPVLINDVLFSLHALIATLFTAIQCVIYERVSNIAKIILSTFFVIVSLLLALAYCNLIHWLDFLYYCSYIKLTITLIKYIPQAVMNYRRKSTVGWSIGCIFLDIIGGVFSILQMILNAHNDDDWVSIFGDPTKFGLGLFSICFDIFFIIQHYVLYRVPTPTLRENDSNLDRLLTEKA